MSENLAGLAVLSQCLDCRSALKQLFHIHKGSILNWGEIACPRDPTVTLLTAVFGQPMVSQIVMGSRDASPNPTVSAALVGTRIVVYPTEKTSNTFDVFGE